MPSTRSFAPVAVLLVVARLASADPIAVSTANPHYFARDGKPIVLVTSDHHYGAVIDRDFNFARFLDTLAASGMNLTRIYPGGMFEAPDKYEPAILWALYLAGKLLPWMRSTPTGASPMLAPAGSPSMKFDLNRWNPEYFDRLKAFVAYAATRGIVVEVALFNGMYADSWPLMAMYHRNNIQGIGNYETDVCGLYTTNDPRNQDVIPYQRAYVAKVATELNAFDNVIFDLSDEPLLQGTADGGVKFLDHADVIPWLQQMGDAFLGAEASLPKKHVLGQTVQSMSPDLSGQSWVQWLPTEYVKAAGVALEKNYAARKPIVDVESDYYGASLVSDYGPDDVRIEGWWFMLGGGAGIINLNSEFHRGQEAGAADTRERILPQRKILRTFVESLDLEHVTRFDGLAPLPEGIVASALAHPGEQYAVYLAHAKGDGQWGAHFVAMPGAYTDTIQLNDVPAGKYAVKWTDPVSGAELGADVIATSGGAVRLPTPSYALDIAMRLQRVK